MSSKNRRYAEMMYSQKGEKEMMDEMNEVNEANEDFKEVDQDNTEEVKNDVVMDLEAAKKEIMKKKLIKGGIIVGCCGLVAGICAVIIKAVNKKNETDEDDELSAISDATDDEIVEVFDI